jgi:hypothetical protein
LNLLLSILISPGTASIVKRNESRFRTPCFTSRDGCQLKHSTKTTDKNQAAEIASEFERVERQAKQGPLTTIQTRKGAE